MKEEKWTKSQTQDVRNNLENWKRDLRQTRQATEWIYSDLQQAQKRYDSAIYYEKWMERHVAMIEETLRKCGK